jgi:hypothetical protein
MSAVSDDDVDAVVPVGLGVKSISTTQSPLHPSSLAKFPSSHSSVPPTVPSPQVEVPAAKPKSK